MQELFSAKTLIWFFAISIINLLTTYGLFTGILKYSTTNIFPRSNSKVSSSGSIQKIDILDATNFFL